MRTKWIPMILGISAAAAFGGLPGAAYAGEADGTAVQQESGGETAEETLTLEVGETEISVINRTGAEVVSITAQAEADTSDAASGTDADSADAAEGVSYTVTVSTADGDHIFEGTDPAQWADAQLTAENSFFYITYTDAGGEEAEAAETADAVTPEQEMTLWASANVNVREEPDVESEKLTVVPLGGECQVTAILPGWYQVKYGEVEGYMNHRYLSSDKEAVDALVQAEKERAAAAAAAAAAAQTASQSSSAAAGQTGTGSSAATGTETGGDNCLNNGLLN